MQPDLRLTYDTLNIRSVNNKIEDVRQLMIDRKLNILALTETWHEDSACSTIKLLRSLGMNVIETARPIPADTDIYDAYFINHGSIAVISRPGIRISKMSMRLFLPTFEHMCCRVTSGGTSMILAVLYRPGSRPPTSEFFEELIKYLELLSTFDLPVTVTGDFNIHFRVPMKLTRRDLTTFFSHSGWLSTSRSRHVTVEEYWMLSLLRSTDPQKRCQLMMSAFRTTFCCPGL